MSQASVYLNKKELAQIRKIGKKLGISDYKVVKTMVQIFLEDPSFLIYEMKHRLGISTNPKY